MDAVGPIKAAQAARTGSPCCRMRGGFIRLLWVTVLGELTIPYAVQGKSIIADRARGQLREPSVYFHAAAACRCMEASCARDSGAIDACWLRWYIATVEIVLGQRRYFRGD